MNKYLSFLGYQGPNTLTALILLSFASRRIGVVRPYIAVLVWQILNHLLNVTLKNVIKAPRPNTERASTAGTGTSTAGGTSTSGTSTAGTSVKVTAANFMTIHRQFGMPSGHAQAVVSALTFIALYFKNTALTSVAVLQTGLTLWQRYTSRKHSLLQLAVGSAIGFLVGVAFYFYI
jgi:membrane-associated phospholipid phosphatase